MASIQWPTIPRSRHIHPSRPAQPRTPKKNSEMFKKCNLRYILKHYLSSNTDLVFKHNDSQYSFQNKNWIHKVIRAYVLFQFVRLPIFRPTEQPVSQVVTVSSFNWWNSFTESACRKLCNFLCWSRIKHFELVNKQIFFLLLELFGLMYLSGKGCSKIKTPIFHTNLWRKLKQALNWIICYFPKRVLRQDMIKKSSPIQKVSVKANECRGSIS